MRFIRTALKGLGPLAIVIAVMAIPSTATATIYPMYWSEYDEDPIDTVITVDVTGTIEVELTGASGSANCEVIGEVELTNNWQDPTSPATQKVINLQPAGSVASSCTGWRSGCPISHVSYSSPWTGITQGYQSDFDNVQIDMEWCGGYLQAPVAGVIDSATTLETGVGEISNCHSGFDIYGASLAGTGYGGGYGATLEGTLEFDLDTLEGLEDDDAGPCVVLADYQG